MPSKKTVKKPAVSKEIVKKINDLTVTKAFEFLNDDKERLFVEYFAAEGDYEKAAKLTAQALSKKPGTFIKASD